MDDTTIKAYEELAEEYDEETAGFWDDFPTAFVEAFTKSLAGPAHVLNIGSGPGRDGSLLYAAGVNVICLDASKKNGGDEQESGTAFGARRFYASAFSGGKF